MTYVHWTRDINGDFGTATYWTGHHVPGASDAAILDAPASPFSVFSSVDETVDVIRLAANAHLYINGGTFTAIAGTGDGYNAGEIGVNGPATFAAGGQLDNSGLIVLGNNGANLLLTSNTTLSGGGLVELNQGTSVVSGVTPSIVLKNVDNTIEGSGELGNDSLTLDNEAGGTIDAGPSSTMIVDTGNNTIVNAGLIETTSIPGFDGTMVVKSPIHNNGMIVEDGQSLTVNRAVTGSGQATIGGGTLNFELRFDQNVAFTGTSGVLVLGHSQAYTAAVTGFSQSGGTSLDLRDIGFVSAGEATFSGTTTSGVLTVTDGVHTANINLVGNYTASTFTVSSDGHGGVTIVDPGSGSAIHQFVVAMAGLGAPATAAMHILEARTDRLPMLSGPRAASA